MKLPVKLLKGTNAKNRLKYSPLEVTTYFVHGIADKLKIAPAFFLNIHEAARGRTIKRRWLKKDANGTFFDFNGVRLPDVSASKQTLRSLAHVFEDTFHMLCFYNDSYEKNIVEHLDKYMVEGPNGYTDGAFDVTVKSGDVVVDAGAWIGDFSAYAAAKGATAYAFEPVEETFQFLNKTAALHSGKIIPVRKGLGAGEASFEMSISASSAGSSIVFDRNSAKTELVHITTLDNFVRENKLNKLSFIKADIEGAERDMLRGATHVLKTFAPKLAICTYHLPDDKEVLERIILEANPRYKVVHLRHKLFAAVV